MKNTGRPTNYKCIVFRLRMEQWEQVRAKIGNTTCTSVTDYFRRLALGKPLYQYYRNRSTDEFVTECIRLRNEMQAIREGRPFSKENELRLIQLQEEIKRLINQLADNVGKDIKHPKHPDDTRLQ